MNFLFLSKLIPLFIYPLGLSCILLLVALVLCLKRSRWTFAPVLLALIILLTASNVRVSNYLVKSLEWQHLPPTAIPNADAIVLLGGATRNASPPRIMPDLNENGDRLFYAAKLYQDGKAPLIIAAGGRIEWYGGEAPEATDMAAILQTMGVPPEAIIEEPNSLNTYQNAVNVKEILLSKGLNRVLLVTSAMHMPRSLLIFQRQGIEAIAAPTDFLVSQQELQQQDNSLESKILSFFPETNSLDNTTKAIKEYIGTFVYRFRGWL
jgi:uncharacterized SAM-binding protein YcdF (DUF218 family)